MTNSKDNKPRNNEKLYTRIDKNRKRNKLLYIYVCVRENVGYLLAILPDILKSRDPMALVMDDTNSGTIRHFSIL